MTAPPCPTGLDAETVRKIVEWLDARAEWLWSCSDGIYDGVFAGERANELERIACLLCGSMRPAKARRKA